MFLTISLYTAPVINSITTGDSELWQSRNVKLNKLFKWWTVGGSRAEFTLCGRLFPMVGQETKKARTQTVDSLTDGTCRRLVCVEYSIPIQKNKFRFDSLKWIFRFDPIQQSWVHWTLVHWHSNIMTWGTSCRPNGT